MLESLREKSAVYWLRMNYRLMQRVWGERLVTLPLTLTIPACEALAHRIEMLAAASSRPIVVVCDGRGGAWIGGTRLATTIRDCKVPVVTVVMITANSASVDVFAAGHIRLMRWGATLGLHEMRVKDISLTKARQAYDALGWGTVATHFRQGFDVYENQARDFLNQLAGQILPDSLFGEEMTKLSPKAARGYGLTDGTALIPAWNVWLKAGR